MRRLLTCAVFAAVVCAPATAAIPDRERAALLAVYNTTDGPHWSVQDWGDAPGNECNWYGVFCDDANSTVIKLDLAYVGAKGPVPPSLTDLVNLEYLSFDGCDLSGPIPPQLSTLSKLKELHLAYNELTSTIPPSLGSLSNLTTLHLSQNPLTGTIPVELGRLSQLQVLEVDGTNIGGAIPSELSALSNLTELTLAYNKLTGPIPDFASWPHLETVQLQRNALTGTIPSSLSQLRNLTTLALSSNQLSGPIPKELGNLSLLTNLSLDDNQLTGTIPVEIYSLRALTTLNLSVNQLTGQIAPAIGNLSALQYLYLDQNKLDGTIPAELMTLVNLQEIVLRENALTGPIPTNIDALTKLSYLSFSNNQLTGTIPPAVANLHDLEVLDLSANALSGTLPPQIGSMTALRHLMLSSNALTGTIPDSYRNLTNLTELYLDYNQLSGPVPDWIATLPNIAVLFLGDNQLTGTLPASITSATGLVYLEVGNNLLTGTLPADIGRLVNLYYLVIGGNDFTGSLPASIGDLKKLNYAILSRMNLSGPLPATLGGLSSIDTLALDENQFTGSIPPELGSLTTLEYLILYGNRFTGGVPPQLGQLKNLLQLDVSYNDLHTLPAELEQLTSLTDGSSDFAFNALTTNDPALAAFVNRKHYDHDFGATQTVPPPNVHITQTTDRSATLEWMPIPYNYNEGGYQVRASLTADGPPVIYATTSDKSQTSITVRNLQPSTTYFFRVATVTHPHDYQQNLVVSDSTAPVSAATGPRVLAPADVVFTATPNGLVQVDGKPVNEDSFTLTNFGDVATSITLLTNDQPFFTFSPSTFPLGPGASQTVKVTSIPQPPGVYYGFVAPQGDGVGDDSSYVTIVLLSAPRAGGNAIAEAQTGRVEVVGLPGSDSIGTVTFRNRGTAPLVGIMTADVPWIVPQSDPIYIYPGDLALVRFQVVRARRPVGVTDGTLIGTLSLIYVGDIPNSAGAVHLDDTTPPAGISITKVTVVDSTKPDVGPANAPQLAAGEVAYFIAGLTSKNSGGSSLASDLHIGNSFGSKPVSDVRLYFTSATQSTVATLNAIGANQAVTLANVVSNVYGSSDAVGSLQIRSREWQSLTLNATLLRLISGAGTSGGDMPVFRSDRALRTTEKMYLTGIRQSDSVHATLYLEDIMGVAEAIHLDFLDANGNAVSARDVSVPQFSTLEITDVPAAAITIAATNTSTSSTAAINAYVRMADDASGDTWSVVDWDRYYAYTRTQPVRLALVAAAGSGGGKRRAVKHSASIGTDATTPRTVTSISMFNSSNVEARATLRAGGVSKDVTIPVRQTLTIADAASFMGTSSAQSLVIDPQRGEIVATSRSSTQGVSGGFVGTAVPLVSATRGLRVGQGQTFPGLEDSAAYRTDYGFVETGGAATTIRATLLLSDARSLFTTVISRDFALAPNGFTLVNDLVKSVLGSTRDSYGDLHNLQLQLEVTDGGGSILPFVVVTDTTTGDQTLRLE